MKHITTKVIGIFIVSFLVCVPAISQFTKDLQKTFDISKNGRLDIDTYKGSITVQTWDEPRITIDATVEADGRSRYDREMVDETEIRINASSDRVDIRTDYGRKRRSGFSFFGIFGDESGNLPFVHYKISMPATAKLKIKDYKSDTKITNLSSFLRINTYKGSVVVEEIDGLVDIETYKGDVRIDFTTYSGNCSFETYKGRIELLLPKEAGFRLEADLGKRSELTSEFDLSKRRKSRGDDYFRTNVNGGGPDLSVKTKKGCIRLYEK